MAENYSRPQEGFRFVFGGMNTRSSADALAPGKYAYLQNVVCKSGNSIVVRPGTQNLFTTMPDSTGTDSSGGNPITDIRAFASLFTDDLPRFLCRDTLDFIYLDTGVAVGSLKRAPDSSGGVSMIPYRPNQSPDPWMYICNVNSYKKYSSPSASGEVVQYNVGIIEPQAPPEACADNLNYIEFTPQATDCTQGGTAGSASDATRSSDTAANVFPDPAVSPATRYSVQVSTDPQYQIGQVVVFDGGTFVAIVQDVLPPINTTTALTIQAVYYYTGTNGRCVIVPSQMPSQGSTSSLGDNPVAASSFAGSIIASLRRGSLVQLSDGVHTEVCFVLNATRGPNNTICFEVSTNNTFAAGTNITGVPAIAVSDIDLTAVGMSITSSQVNFNVTAGTGTSTEDLTGGPGNPFDHELSPPSILTAQQDDYLHFSLKMDDLNNFVNGVLSFDVAASGDSSTQEYSYSFDLSDIVSKQPTDAQTIYPSDEWVEFAFPISALTRLGTDQSQTLINCTSVTLSLTVTATVAVSISSYWVAGGGQPDVGDAGSPYFYAIRPRSTLTGAAGNPSPVTRYGVSPRRQAVTVPLPVLFPDPQVDVWDVFRYGGSLTSFRYIGSQSLGASQFIDNVFDDAATAGDELSYDNFQPWPTIDLPFTPMGGSGLTVTFAIVGTIAVLQYSSSSPFTNPAPSTIARWLPGTLVLLGGQAYTLWTRPQPITLLFPADTYYYAYLFQFVENVGTGSYTPGPGGMSITEPDLANQVLPYVWGPDAFGTVFGCGDPFRPGNLYWINKFNPDSVSDANNQEVTNPSEPLLGGEIINGEALVASTKRWFRIVPQLGNTENPYQLVELPVGRGLAAPYAHCTDGKTVYFVAKDGIWTTGGDSLTDEDLWNLFPHEGVPGTNVPRGTYTAYAPDYGYASLFRMAYCNSYLFFDYCDATGTPRTLRADLRNGVAWSVDLSMCSPFTTHYAVEQQEGNLVSSRATYPLLLIGDDQGDVLTEAESSNDNCAAVECTGGTPHIASLDPSRVDAGASSFTLTVAGVNFRPDSVVLFGGSPLTTTYISGIQLQAAVPGTAVETIGSIDVVVNNPDPGCGDSNASEFAVTEACNATLFKGGLFGFRPDTGTAASFMSLWGVGTAAYTPGGAFSQIVASPVDANIANLWAHTSADQTGGVTTTLTAYQDSIQTALACVIPPGSTDRSFSDTSDYLLVKSGEMFGFELTVAGGSGTSIRGVSGTYAGVNGEAIIGWRGKNATVLTGATDYLFLGSAQKGGTESENQVRISFNCTILGIFPNMNSTQPASGSLVLTLRVNGSSETVSKTVEASGIAGLRANPIDSADIVAGSLVTVAAVNNASAASGQIAGVSLPILATDLGYPSLFPAHANTTMAGTQTFYYSPFAELATSISNIDEIAYVIPVRGTLQDFWVHGGTAGNAGSQIVWELWKKPVGGSAAATGYKKTLGGSMATDWYAADGGAPVQFAPGDLAWVQVAHSGSGTDPIFSLSFTFVPEIP